VLDEMEVVVDGTIYQLQFLSDTCVRIVYSNLFCPGLNVLYIASGQAQTKGT
jgi:hypothetical protein